MRPGRINPDLARDWFWGYNKKETVLFFTKRIAMNPEEIQRLKRLYQEMPEQQLIDMLSEDESDFQEGVYLLLVGEAKRRGLDDKLDEIKRMKEEKKAERSQKEYKFINVYTSPKLAEIAVIKSILDAQNIPYHIKGENFGTLYGPADGLSSMDILIREDYSEDAKELLKDFLTPKNRGCL